jgi:hypothetical protein
MAQDQSNYVMSRREAEELADSLAMALNAAQIPCVLWGHHLLQAHGIPTYTTASSPGEAFPAEAGGELYANSVQSHLTSLSQTQVLQPQGTSSRLARTSRSPSLRARIQRRVPRSAISLRRSTFISKA